MVDNAKIELDTSLRNLKRNGPYPYGGGPFPDPYDTADVAYLNDPFTFLNGNRVKSPADWDARRTEIKQIAQYCEFGWAPPAPAITASSSGAGTTKTITINVTREWSFVEQRRRGEAHHANRNQRQGQDGSVASDRQH